MKTHGDVGWEKYPSYLDVLIPYVTDLLSELDHRITFFIVGRDANDQRNSEALSMITKCGHEVGNHSFEHEPWLHLHSREAIFQEINRTDELIRKATGKAPVGFRGPGYCCSSDILEILVDHGYLFDASNLPTCIGPIARMYYFWTSDFTKEERKKRNLLFGRLTDGFRSIRPHTIVLPSGRTILEIPVTTVPVFRTPFHLSYLLYLSRYSVKLMKAYLEIAISLCQVTRTEPSFLLHPLDLLGGDQISALSFFPGMDVKADEKRLVFEIVLRRITKTYCVVPMSEHARSIRSRHETGVNV
jgi:hypothetical protein